MEASIDSQPDLFAQNSDDSEIDEEGDEDKDNGEDNEEEIGEGVCELLRERHEPRSYV